MIASFQLRRALAADMEVVARLHRHVRFACLPYLPELHTPEEDLAFFQRHVFPSSTVWLAEARQELIGFSVLTPDWLDHLYVSPSWHGQGVGTALLDTVKVHSVELNLWTFQRNEQARRFYEKNGFVSVVMTDGSDNEEKEPDIHYRWIKE
jgi:putative acetyltransferase